MTGRLGYGRLGYFRLGSDEAAGAGAPLIIALSAASVPVAGVWTPQMLVPLPAAAVPVGGAWTLVLGGAPLIIDLPAAEVPVAGVWTAHMTVAVSAAAVPVTGTWELVGMTSLLIDLSSAEVAVTGVWTPQMLVPLPAAAVPVGGAWTLDATLWIELPPVEITVDGRWQIRLDSRGPTDPVPPHPFVITLRYPGTTDIDISHVTLKGFTFDKTLGVVPSGLLTIHDLDGLVPWPPPPGYDPSVENPERLPELIIATAEDGPLFAGQVISFPRKALRPGWKYALRIEGWQRLAPVSPVQPLTTAVTTVTGPNGLDITPFGAHIGRGDGPPVPDSAVIASALSAWTGPALAHDIPYRRSVGWTIRPNGASMTSVLDDIAARIGTDDIWWIDGPSDALVGHWRPGFVGGVDAAHLRAPSRYIAPFFLTDRFNVAGGVTTSDVDEGLDGSAIRRGAYVTGLVPAANASVWSGPDWSGMDVLHVDAEEVGIPQLMALGAMSDKRTWRRSLTVILPPGSPMPPYGDIIGLEDAEYVPVMQFFLIRSVHAELKIHEGVLGLEYTVQLGDSDRRSYVYEQAEKAAIPKPEPPQAIHIEIPPVIFRGLDSDQYVIGYPEDPKGERVRLRTGTVRWDIVTDAGHIGAGSPEAGWYILEGDHTDIVWSEAEQLGYAVCTLHCQHPAEVGPLPTIEGTLLV